MATPTDGDDVLANNPLVPIETIAALRGDDVITLRAATGITQLTTVDGGQDSDTLIVNLAADQRIAGTGYSPRSLRIENTAAQLAWAVNYDRIERIEINGAVDANSLSFDNLSVILRLTSAAADNNRITINTDNKTDEFYLTGTAAKVTVRLYDGDDIADLSDLVLADPNGQSTDIASLYGNDGDDRLTGSLSADFLDGGSGDDILRGMAGDDSLLGATGDDHMEGGAGDDRYTVDSFADVVIETAGNGIDTILADMSYALDYVNEIERLAFRFPERTNAYNLTGNALANEIIGNNGANVLDGRGGADTLRGSRGDDIYHVENAGDRVIEAAGEGSDLVIAASSYALAADQSIEFLMAANAAATAPQNLIGNNVGNTIQGSAGANLLDGRGGADTLAGFGGDDVYYVDQAADVVVEVAGNGFDRVYASANYVLAANVDVELLAAANPAGPGLTLIGNQLDNRLYGTQSDDKLIGGAGADLMYGLGGNDTYYVDRQSDYVLEAAGGGSDRINTATSYALRASDNVEVLAAYAVTSAVVLRGNAIGNTLYGSQYADRLDGAGGADMLRGLGGNDIYYVDQAGDFVAESAGGGTDSVYASASYVLPAQTEVELLAAATGAVGLTLVGNELANRLFGGASGETLEGGRGRDILYGFGGSDTFRFAASGTADFDTVGDFITGLDRIALVEQAFAGLPLGMLDEAAFRASRSALDADDRILYDATSGLLQFDSDGVGGAAAVAIAVLESRPLLSFADIIVV